jgi:hypothetical protein
VADEYTETFEQILKDTMPQTPGIIRELALRELRLAAREFFERSFAWIKEIEAIDTPAGNVPVQVVCPNPAGGSSDVILLADMDGADGATTYTERSLNAAVASFVGNAQLDTAQSQFGTASLLLDGTGDYQEYPDNPAFALGSGLFTIQGFVRFNSLPAVGDEMTLVSQWSTSTGTDQAFAISLIQDGGSYRIRFEAEDTVGVFEQGSISAPPLNTWIHFVAQRSAGDTLSIWWDGNLEFEAGGIFSGAIQDSTETVKLGVFDPTDGFGNEGFLDGWLDEVQISTVAEYATGGAITVPTSAFPIPTPAADPNVEVIPGFTSDAPRGWFVTSNPDEFQFFPRLETSLVGETSALVALIPSFDTLLLPRQVTLKYYDAIVEGYLARVYNHPNKPYSNPAVAAQLRHNFTRRIGYYMAQRKQGYNNSQQWRYPPGWNVRRLGGNG